jgi:hypothetical protein
MKKVKKKKKKKRLIRIPIAPPSQRHKTKKDYNRQEAKLEVKEMEGEQ